MSPTLKPLSVITALPSSFQFFLLKKLDFKKKRCIYLCYDITELKRRWGLSRTMYVMCNTVLQPFTIRNNLETQYVKCQTLIVHVGEKVYLRVSSAFSLPSIEKKKKEKIYFLFIRSRSRAIVLLSDQNRLFYELKLHGFPLRRHCLTKLLA